MAEKVAQARYLLECVYEKPVLFRSASTANNHQLK
jgi:hypothetical protein